VDADGLLDGEIIVSRVVQRDDVVVVVNCGDVPVLEAVGMLAMAADSLLHPELTDDV
jgi:hypothetical protein